MKKSKSNHNDDAGDSKVSVESVDWLMLQRSGSMTSEKLKEFDIWLKDEPENEKMYNRVKYLWQISGALQNKPFTAKVIQQSQAKERKAAKKANQQRSLNLWFPGFRSMAVTMSVLLFIVGGWLVYNKFSSDTRYYTTTGTQQSILLSDGSTIFLDSETEIIAKLTKEIRSIELKEGRAMFSVAHDPDRPFVVIAGEINIRALGTVFAVTKIHTGKINVSVTEGKVQIVNKQLKDVLIENKPPTVLLRKERAEKSITDPLDQAPIITASVALTQEVLQSGQEIIIDEKIDTYQIAPADTNRTTSWQDGRLYFDKAPLFEVIAEVNRYLDQKIVINDDRLNDVEVKFKFNIDQCRFFLDTLKEVVPIKTRSSIDGSILISMNKPNQQVFKK